MTTTPNALSMQAEHVGARIRINGGAMPTSFWMLKQHNPDDRNHSAADMAVEGYATRELAVAGYRAFLLEELAAVNAEGDPDALAAIESAVSDLHEDGGVSPDVDPIGYSVHLEEVVLWSGMQRTEG